MDSWQTFFLADLQVRAYTSPLRDPARGLDTITPDAVASRLFGSVRVLVYLSLAGRNP